MVLKNKEELKLSLIAEKASLEERFMRLDRFILSSAYGTLPVEDRLDLSAQWRYMKGYVEILQRRIDRLNGVLIGV